MIYPKIQIDPSRYKWAIEKTDVDKIVIYKNFPKLDDWISGKDQPTMNQLSNFSLQTHIPIGYFFLDTPPTESIELLKYRTLQSHPNSYPSKNLLDTILHMTNLQDWMREYFINYIENKNNFVASLKNVSTIELMVHEIRNKLNIKIDWFKNISGNNTQKNFKFIRSRIQALDIIVMMNGIVGLNTKRSLDINEFRAFTMIDDYIPLIFINSKDSYTGRIFSLIHELAHVAIGVNSLFNLDINTDLRLYNDIEKNCNAVAAEILVPIELFKAHWHEDKSVGNFDKISSLAKYFKVSELVIARRAVDLEYISKSDYKEINDTIQSTLKITKKNSQGDSYNNFLSRFDFNCLKIINQCTKTGYLLYTDAYCLTGLSRTFFDKIMINLDERS
jgi:Zn-dependent peptidase ImmA (M78 family)